MKLICSDEIGNIRPSLNSSITHTLCHHFSSPFQYNLIIDKVYSGWGNSISIGRLITITSWLANSKDLFGGGMVYKRSVHEGDKVHTFNRFTMKGPKIWKGYVQAAGLFLIIIGVTRARGQLCFFFNFFKILIFCLMPSIKN